MSVAAETLRQVEVKVKTCTACGARFGRDAAFCPFDGHALSATTWDRAVDAWMPSRVADRHDVVEAIGQGGMGTVYEVRHATLGRAFAMKVLRCDLERDADLAERFVQEAKATARIRHPAIVAIADFGTLDNGVPWFVMDLLAGKTLATELQEKGPLPAARVIALGARIAEGLAASHAAHVIHRDLEPGAAPAARGGDPPGAREGSGEALRFDGRPPARAGSGGPEVSPRRSSGRPCPGRVGPRRAVRRGSHRALDRPPRRGGGPSQADVARREHRHRRRAPRRGRRGRGHREPVTEAGAPLGVAPAVCVALPEPPEPPRSHRARASTPSSGALPPPPLPALSTTPAPSPARPRGGEEFRDPWK